MSKKIEKLTAEQEKYLPVFRQEYFEAATSSRRIDRRNLELAIADAYAECGIKKIPYVIILQSPLQAMMAIKFMKHFAAKEAGDQLRGQLRDQLRDQLGGQLRDQLGDQLRGQLRDQLRDQLGGQLRDQLGGQLWDQLRDQLGGQLGGQLWDQLGGQLGGQLWDQLRGQLGGQLRDQLGDQLGGQKDLYDPNYLWGSQDLYWIAWAKFAEQIGVQFTDQQSKRLEIMRRIGFECEWWWPFEGFCFVSEKPTIIKWDDNRRLHGETGPAVEYADGYSLYAWHGTRIPDEWIKDRASLTPDIALKHQNAEQRRCAMEIIGWDKLLSDLGAKIVDKDEDDTVGQLYEANHPALGGKCKFLRMYCPTGRWFAEPVPPEMKTALEANAWGWDLPAEIYKPRIQA